MCWCVGVGWVIGVVVCGVVFDILVCFLLKWKVWFCVCVMFSVDVSRKVVSYNCFMNILFCY